MEIMFFPNGGRVAVKQISDIGRMLGLAALLFILSSIIDGFVAALSLLGAGEAGADILLHISRSLSATGLIVYVLTLILLGGLRRFFAGFLFPTALVLFYWLGVRLLLHVHGSLPRVVPVLARQQYLTVAVIAAFCLCVYYFRTAEAARLT